MLHENPRNTVQPFNHSTNRRAFGSSRLLSTSIQGRKVCFWSEDCFFFFNGFFFHFYSLNSCYSVSFLIRLESSSSSALAIGSVGKRCDDDGFSTSAFSFPKRATTVITMNRYSEQVPTDTRMNLAKVTALQYHSRIVTSIMMMVMAAFVLEFAPFLPKFKTNKDGDWLCCGGGEMTVCLLPLATCVSTCRCIRNDTQQQQPKQQ